MRMEGSRLVSQRVTVMRVTPSAAANSDCVMPSFFLAFLTQLFDFVASNDTFINYNVSQIATYLNRLKAICYGNVSFMDTLQEVSSRIKKARKNCGFTQAQLAALLGVSRLTITRWESNAGCLSLGQLQQLAAILNSTLAELLGIDEPARHKQIQSIALDNSELTLVTIYRQLNDTGKQALLQQAAIYDEAPSLKQ